MRRPADLSTAQHPVEENINSWTSHFSLLGFSASRSVGIPRFPCCRSGLVGLFYVWVIPKYFSNSDMSFHTTYVIEQDHM